MHDIGVDLLILLAGIWLVAVTLRPLGLPTIMGELIVGVLVGPAVLGWIEPSEAINLLAEIGIFFLMFHAGVETQPRQFLDALRRSLGVAIVGAIVPFSVSFGVATAFGLEPVGATFVGLTMTATAVVITLKSLKDLGLADTRVARVIVASCVIDDLLTLVFFGLIVGVLSGGSFEASDVALTLLKVLAFFAAAFVLGRFVYPRLTLPFRAEGGKGFTFVLLVAIAAGLFAEAIGLHMILGAYLAGLFFEERVAHPNLVRVVADRSYGIAYSFLGPIFFISLGFSITFDISGSGVAFLLLLTATVLLGQVVSAGGMALRMGLPAREALTVGVGMSGRAELAFILASLALAQGAISPSVFSVLIFTAFLLNLLTPLGLKACAVLLQGQATRLEAGAGVGVLMPDKFRTGVATAPSRPPTLPDVDGAIVLYGHTTPIDSLIEELALRRLNYLVLEEDEAVARRLDERGRRVIMVTISDQNLDLTPLARARTLVLNGGDEDNVLLALNAREVGFEGRIVALISDPRRRSAMLSAGVDVTFAPAHILAAALSSRASVKIGPRVTGLRPLRRVLEVVELRVHEGSPLAERSLAEVKLRTRTGVNVVGQWREGRLDLPPAPDETISIGTILVAVGTPPSIEKLADMTRPTRDEGLIIVIGRGAVGDKLVEILRAVEEHVLVVGPADRQPDLVGDISDPALLDRLPIAESRVAIVALESDSATMLAVTMLRDHAQDLPIVAGLQLSENVSSTVRAGADFALSVSQIAGQLLAQHVLGETVSLQPRIKLFRAEPGPLEGKHPLGARIRERTGCTVVAVERGDEVLMKFAASFRLEAGDRLYICGTAEAIARFQERFPAPWL
ncbi:MAG TPA: cation:proton antiporter [Longimicrobiales bacterium]|nr:cation:proton antiporter [Longimicrobiales bacterium]